MRLEEPMKTSEPSFGCENLVQIAGGRVGHGRSGRVNQLANESKHNTDVRVERV